MVASMTAEQDKASQATAKATAKAASKCRTKCYRVFSVNNFLVTVTESGFVPGWLQKARPILHGTWKHNWWNVGVLLGTPLPILLLLQQQQ